MSQAKHIC